MSLKFNKISDLKYSENYIFDILENRGIENPEMFLNPKKHLPEIETNPFNFYNMDKAIEIMKNSIDKNELIGVLVDDDADGYSSASALIKYIIHIRGDHNQIEWFFHSQKSHGLTKQTFNEMKNSDCDLIIIPDAASNDFEQQEELLKLGKKIIILDHHLVDNQDKILEISEKNKHYALANNQLKFNTKPYNKNFVGAGMVYKFCEAYDIKYGYDFSDELLDLIAMGQIGDASDISDYEINYIVKEGLENLNSDFMKEVLSGKATSDKIAPINLSFSIIPIINAISRVGCLEEKDLLLKSLFNYWPVDEFIEVEKRRKNKSTGKFNKVLLKWTMYQYAADELSKVKAKQDKITNKLEKQLSSEAFTNGICIVKTNEETIEFRSVTGLIANKIMSRFKMPTLVLVKNKDNTFSGSGRGFEKTVKDFRQWCLSTNLFDLAQGHDNAFGVIIPNDNLELLKHKLKVDFTETNEDSIVYDVDEIYNNESNLEEVKVVNNNNYIFGGKLVEPTYGYKNLIISRAAMSQRGSVVTFYHDGLEFICYKQDVGAIDSLKESAGFQQYFSVDLVGHPSRNNWSGRIKEQIVLDAFSFNDYSGEEPVIETPEDNWIGENGELIF